jgi:hypothetical protein
MESAGVGLTEPDGHQPFIGSGIKQRGTLSKQAGRGIQLVVGTMVPLVGSVVIG